MSMIYYKIFYNLYDIYIPMYIYIIHTHICNTAHDIFMLKIFNLVTAPFKATGCSLNIVFFLM